MHDHFLEQKDSGQGQMAAQGSASLFPPDMNLQPILEWRGVSLQFEGRQVLNDINVWVGAGELTCLCGANGAGKTQL